MTLLRVVVDDLMPGVDAVVARLSGADLQVTRHPGRTLAAADVAAADILLVRSVTRVDAALLQASPVRFVGTATIGIDHLDTRWLAARGIAWSAAPGCNARAVAEWVLATLVRDGVTRGLPLSGRRLGIVGLGHVGRALARLAVAAGLQVAFCDPLLAAGPVPADLAQLPRLDLDNLLASSDVVSLHVPLTREGQAPTLGLMHADQLARLPAGSLLINASRGEVVPTQALADALASGRLRAALDVWCDEPRPDPALVHAVAQGSPHIAGHSLEGKWHGTWQIVQALADRLGLSLQGALADVLPDEGRLTLQVPVEGSDDQRLADLLLQAVPLVRDDEAFRAAMAEDDPGAAFDRLRKRYPVRREFAAHRVCLADDDPLRPRLAALGFSLA